MRPVEQALMRERYQLGIDEALFFGYILIVATVAIVSPGAPTSGTIICAVLLASVAPLPRIVHGLSTSFSNWLRYAFAAELLCGIGWGSVTWLALPESEVRQALLCTVLTGVMVAASISAAQFRRLNLAFLVPFAGLSITGYLLTPDALSIAALFLAIAFAFSVVMAAENREVHLSLIRLIVANDELVNELEEEHEALTNANRLLDDQAWTDALTGLANRPALANELAERLEQLAADPDRSEPVTVAYLDLNGFKQVNDVWGHHTGDLLLIAVANRLRKTIESGALPTNSLAARLGGDEFVVISPEAPETLASVVAGALAKTLSVGDRRLPVRTSLGVAAGTPTTDPDELLRHADRALYRHKHTPGQTADWRIFDEAMQHELAVRRDFEHRVHAAFENGDIEAWYQPIVTLATGEIVGAEALARWSDGNEVHQAGAFLDVLTEEGLLDDLTERTFVSANALQIEVENAGYPRPRISINVAAQQLEQVLTNRSSAGDLAAIAIEVTEESAIPNPERVGELLTKARELGAEILVDDFGTGYSSLARTASLPIDALKIDRSFVATLLTSKQSTAVVSTVVDLADKLELDVIAEGVETTEQADKLLDLGVTVGQGFLFSAAVPASQLTKWLCENHRFIDHLGDIAKAA